MDFDTQKFASLCEHDRIMHQNDGDSIGTYNEKRLHRVLKRYITEDAECYEVRLGNYVADVVYGGQIIEIQTGSFRSLRSKIKYYLEQTDFNVCIIKPIIAEKMLIRADKETGEINSVKRSPKREREIEAAAQMFYLSEHVTDNRFEICFAHVRAEEYRFSEAVRYRKSGRYDNDLRPVELLDMTFLCGKEDYYRFIPQELFDGEFDAAEYSALTKLNRRELYGMLNLHCRIGVLQMRAEGRKHIYSVVK